MSDLSNENSNKKQRLGRGLGSLLGGSQENLSANTPSSQAAKMPTQSTQMNTQPPSPPPVQISPEARIWQISIDKLSASEYQPRTHFEKEKLEELSQSIKQNGILQPIVARKLASGKLEIIAGERRWRAAQMAGLHEVPVILKTIENQAALELAIIENIQREDLNAIEEGEAYQRLATEFNLTQQQVAEKVGKDRATVANMMRLLALPLQIRDMVSKSEISAGHAKVLLGLPQMNKQLEMAKKIVQQKISVRQLEKLVATELTEHKSPKDGENKNSQNHGVRQSLIAGMADELQKILGTKVTIDYMNSKGRISVHFYSDEELTQIVDHLKEGHG